MSDPGKVWAVSSGSYSDYAVECCFVTEELAVAYCAARNGVTVEQQQRQFKLWQKDYDFCYHGGPRLTDEERRELNELRRFRYCFVEEFDLYDTVPAITVH